MAQHVSIKKIIKTLTIQSLNTQTVISFSTNTYFCFIIVYHAKLSRCYTCNKESLFIKSLK